MKYSLDSSVPNSALYDKSFGINLMNFEERLKEQTITNALLHQRSNNITGIVQRQALDNITIYLKTPSNIFCNPILTKKRNVPLLLHQSQTLYQGNLQIRTAIDEASFEIANQLSMEQYNTHYKQLYYHKTAGTLNSITDLQRTNRNNEIKSYSEFFESLPSTSQRRETRVHDAVTTAPFYQAIQASFSAEFISPENLANPNHHTQIKQYNLPYDINPPLLPELNVPQETIWTDGSYFANTNQLGAAAVSEQREHFSTLKLPDSFNNSSTRAELYGYHCAIALLPANTHLTIMTDSQVGIQQSIKSQSNSISERDILKLSNNHILQINSYHTKRIKSICMKHVYSHRNDTNPNNDMADNLAKDCATSRLEPTFSNPIAPINLIAHHSMSNIYSNHVMADSYPTYLIKKEYQRTLKEDNHNIIIKKWSHLNTPIETDISIQLTRMPFTDSQFLNATHIRELKFRVKLIFRQSATMATLHKRTIVASPKCPRCLLSAETQDHLFRCYKVQDEFDEMMTKFNDLHKTRAEKRNISLNPAHQEIMNLLQFNNKSTFMLTAQSQGIITTSLLQQYFQIYDNYFVNVPKKKQFLIHVIDCYLSAFYLTVWKNRCLMIDKPPRFKTNIHDISDSSITPPTKKRKPLQHPATPPPPEPPPSPNPLIVNCVLFGR